MLAKPGTERPRSRLRRASVEPGGARRGRILDRELVERAQRGDEAAFGALAVRISNRMYAIAHHILRDTDRADDAAQQAMIDIWRHLPELKDPDRFNVWVHRIVVRAAYAEARRLRTWTLRVDSVGPDRRDSPDVAAAVAERDQLERGFTRLKLDHRAVVVLKHYAGLSNEEIAEALEIPIGTVRSRLHYSIRTMRAALEADARTGVNGERA